MELNISFDSVIGVSAGISFGVSYCSRQKRRNLQILRQYQADKRYMGARYLLNRKNKSYYNLEFVYDAIPNQLIPFDYAAFDAKSEKCEAVMTRLDNGKAEYMEMVCDKQFTMLRATCALPLLFQPIEINGVKYMDGGISDAVPFKKAFDEGCEKTLTILTRPRSYVKEKEPATPLIKSVYRKYPEFVKAFEERPDRYNQSMAELRESEKLGKSFVIAPAEEDINGIGRTERDPVRLEKLYWKGYEQMKAREDEFMEFLRKM